MGKAEALKQLISTLITDAERMRANVEELRQMGVSNTALAANLRSTYETIGTLIEDLMVELGLGAK